MKTAEVNKDLMSAAKLGNRAKEMSLKEIFGLLQAEGKTYEEKKEQHEKEFSILMERCREADKKIHNSEVTQLPTTEERG